MDWGFAPGLEQPKKFTQAGRLRRLFQRRLGKDQLVQERKDITSINELIKFLTATVTLPIDNLFLGAHANEKGKLALKMFRGQKREENDKDVFTTFETLERTQVPLPSPPNPPDTPDPTKTVDLDKLIQP